MNPNNLNAGIGIDCQNLSTVDGVLGSLNGANGAADLKDDNSDCPNGELVTFNKFQLTSTDTLVPLVNPINLDENLNPNDGFVWTGTEWDGTLIPSPFPSISNCEDWTTSDSDTNCSNGDSNCGALGDAGIPEKEWTLIGEPQQPRSGREQRPELNLSLYKICPP
jgi:hypothetical protein